MTYRYEITVTDSDSAHRIGNLVLAIINDGRSYKKRCDMARRPRAGILAVRPSEHHLCAVDWLRYVGTEATRITREHPDMIEGKPYTAIELLAVAADLAAYYDRHVKEADACAKA